MELPPTTARLFEPADGPPSRHELIARLLEEGESLDLRWLKGRTEPGELADWVQRFGARLLSRRSRLFWETVLEVESAPRSAVADELWPL